MDQRSTSTTPPSVTFREFTAGEQRQIAFSWGGAQCRELLPHCAINKSSIQRAASLCDEVRRKIGDGTFDYAAYFPDSPKAKAKEADSTLMERMLEEQLATYKKQVENSQMAPATYVGYAKAITAERMRAWHGKKLREVTPSALREWISTIDCTSKSIRNLLIPLRSVFEDA